MDSEINVNKLEEQNERIKKRWEKIYPHSDEDSVEAPLLKEELDEKKFNHYDAAIDGFVTKNADTIEHLASYRDEYQIYYEDEGRLPKTYNKTLYIFWVMFLVLLEVPTNYSTIEQFLHKPVISGMITVAVGSLLVFIAHAHGSFFKQLPFIKNISEFDVSHNKTSRKTRYIFAIAGFMGLLIIMYGLYYARLQYFNTVSGVDVDDPFSDGSGADLVTATIFTKVGILMLANFAIYILGVVGSYMVHEVVPGFQEAYYNMQKFKKKLQKEYLEFKKQLDGIARARTVRGK